MMESATREFRLTRPVGPTGEDDLQRSASTLAGWELEEARSEYLGLLSLTPTALGFASVLLLTAMTLSVTLGLNLGLPVLGVGALLAPRAVSWLRRTVSARRRLKRLEAGSG
jgi:hypothetical protein